VVSYESIGQALRTAGLALRGGFHPSAGDGLPPLPDGGPARSLLLVGMVGPEGWSAFSASPEAALPDHPLDAWTRRVVGDLARGLEATALFPFEGPPYWPFQRWAMRTEPVAVSPLGILIHPEYGLWHAYRAALLLADRLELPPRPERSSPCEACADKPCLSACPVGAFTGSSYRVEDCAAHIWSPAGALCMEEGCRARDACPIGRGYRYSADQIRFHMQAFRRARMRQG
jgi:ferredoxin